MFLFSLSLKVYIIVTPGCGCSVPAKYKTLNFVPGYICHYSEFLIKVLCLVWNILNVSVFIMIFQHSTHLLLHICPSLLLPGQLWISSSINVDYSLIYLRCSKVKSSLTHKVFSSYMILYFTTFVSLLLR